MWTFRDALSTWVGALSRGGLLWSNREEEGVVAAAGVVGDERLEELSSWFGTRTQEQLERERVATIKLCIWLARADRNLDDTERDLIADIVAHSDLGASAREHLLEELAKDTEVDRAAAVKELTHPVLQELMLAMAWQIVRADGKVEQAERSSFAQLAADFGLTEEVASRVRSAVDAADSKE
ncbi:MAG: DUF533 domain-containing protein [Polyangiaceae bacterium]